MGYGIRGSVNEACRIKVYHASTDSLISAKDIQAGGSYEIYVGETTQKVDVVAEPLNPAKNSHIARDVMTVDGINPT